MGKKFCQQEAISIILDMILQREIPTLPEIKTPTISMTKKGDEEEIVLLLSDWQLGHRTETFDANIARKRIDELLKATVKISSLHRKAYPIKNINLFVMGDMVQNDRIGYLIDLSELEKILMYQIFEDAIPLLQRVITTLAKHFEQVKVFCVRGNHGRGDIGSSEKTNWDDVIYKVTEMSFKENKS